MRLRCGVVAVVQTQTQIATVQTVQPGRITYLSTNNSYSCWLLVPVLWCRVEVSNNTLNVNIWGNWC